jgi:hypothetical protein
VEVKMALEVSNSGNEFKHFRVVIYDLLGKEIVSSSFFNSNLVLKKEKINSGDFFYKILSEGTEKNNRTWNYFI